MKHSDFEKDKKKTPQKENSPELLGMTQNITIDNIQEHFPALHTELTVKKMSLGISEVKSGVGLSPNQHEDNTDPLSNYDPDIFDFLARATTEEEGYEIIEMPAIVKIATMMENTPHSGLRENCNSSAGS